MKIALVSPYSLEVFGGVQSQVRGLAQSLSETQEVSVIAPGPSVTIGGIVTTGVGRVTPVAANGPRAPITLAPSSWRATRAALRAIAPDVIHIHEPFVPMVGLASMRDHQVPIAATFHRGGSGCFYPLLAPLLRHDFQKIGARVAVSEEARDTLRDVFGPAAASMEILPNAVNLERFSSAPKSEPSTQPVIVFVGRHETRKGLAVLLQAFGAGIGEARLEVIGDGPEREHLQQRFGRPGVIDFLGAIDDPALTDRLVAAEVLVAPSISGESFGIVLLEAMAARTAVVASAIPGYQLAAGDAAAFVPPGDAVALRGKLVELLASPQQRADLVTKGLQRASEYSFAALAARDLTLYRELLET